jgi:hypothetical protein
MNTPKLTFVIAIILTVILFVTGVYIWNSFFFLFLPVIHGVNYIGTDLTTLFQNSLVFSLTLALIPVASVLTWRFAPVLSRQRKILTVCIIVIAMMVSVLIRREVIKSQIRNMRPSAIIDYSDPANPVQKNFMAGFPVSDLKFEYFLLAGLVAGSAISLFVLKEKNNQVLTKIKKTTF